VNVSDSLVVLLFTFDQDGTKKTITSDTATIEETEKWLQRQLFNVERKGIEYVGSLLKGTTDKLSTTIKALTGRDPISENTKAFVGNYEYLHKGKKTVMTFDRGIILSGADTVGTFRALLPNQSVQTFFRVDSLPSRSHFVRANNNVFVNTELNIVLKKIKNE